MTTDDPRLAELLAAAQGVADRAYSPYSGVRVGAALEGADGRVHLGCNVENASYGATICAERSALSAAVAAGASDLTRLVLWASPRARLMPCGVCRQVLAELAPDLEVVVASSGAAPAAFRLSELLPHAVRGDDLR